MYLKLAPKSSHKSFAINCFREFLSVRHIPQLSPEIPPKSSKVSNYTISTLEVRTFNSESFLNFLGIRTKQSPLLVAGLKTSGVQKLFVQAFLVFLQDALMEEVSSKFVPVRQLCASCLCCDDARSTPGAPSGRPAYTCEAVRAPWSNICPRDGNRSEDRPG